MLKGGDGMCSLYAAQDKIFIFKRKAELVNLSVGTSSNTVQAPFMLGLKAAPLTGAPSHNIAHL